MAFPADALVLEITDTSSSATAAAARAPSSPSPPPLSISDLARFDPLPSPTVAVRVDRHRLIESSSYFRALLGGSFSESGREHVRVGCNLEAAVQVLRYLFEPSESFNITHNNFLPLLEGALFLAVESLLVECQRWFGTIASQTSAMSVPLDFIIEVWYFAEEHGVTFVQDICQKFLAQNFAHAISGRSFNKIPYDLLCSAIKCPHLTVDSEKQLCEAILYWVSENMKACEQSNPNSVDGHLFILSKQVKICLLPLGFAAGTMRHWFDFGNKIICTILDLLKDSLKTLLDAVDDGNLDRYCIRITEYSKNIVLSGCPQVTTAFLYISVLPNDLSVSLKRRIVSSYTQVDHQTFVLYEELEKATKTLSFKNVHMVDISKCPNVHFGAAIDWLKLGFPELRVFRVSHCLSFQFDDLLYLLMRCPWIDEIDMTIDTSTVTPRHSVISSSSEVLSKAKPNQKRYGIHCSAYDRQPNSVFLNISRLTLEGRNDIDDMDLLEISVLKNSLCYINIRNCFLLTDDGISNLLMKCTKIHSMVLSYTSFGNRSIQMLCAANPSGHNSGHAHVMASYMQELHLDGCKGIDSVALSQLVSIISITKFLSLRETSLTDGALCKFVGSSLEYLDVSETVISMVSLAPVIQRNCKLNCLKTAGCCSLLLQCANVEHINGNKYGDFLQELGTTYCLEDVEMGWGFCPIRIEDLVPSFSKVRKMKIGLGTSLAENVLCALPMICPFLESLILRFQVISDRVVRRLLESATNLQVLCLHYCLGSLTSFSFQTKAPALRVLRLHWVTSWLTNDDLTILTENCNLAELSLSGCKLLDSSSQDIISSGWPNLALLHLEECGKVTVEGVSSFFNCKALEDVLLRHTGRGIGRSIIDDAIRELPLLRKLALDLCDACEDGYDSPNDAEGKMIRSVRMSRCKKMAGSCLEVPRQGSSTSRPVHKDTVVLEWSSRMFTTTIVKERV
ncbi:BTB/POZ domain-containing protein FBL11 isoform X1 [Zea mays]|uniref:Ubiquitin-protein ligase n=1 Tax=Zea mays TaxID=4577 RepID=A0A1D6N0D2_MAIZE|nr:BTB/POZ domain-containing protein FBL11 isoform X1 [Zea mays]ONM34249.1 ubiquitin-protein ligase [Zea mays]|eukprot:XP_008674481.1 BTB/POZ domain-containing protein FBL11 isoform X1 [Zea mays]